MERRIHPLEAIAGALEEVEPALRILSAREKRELTAIQVVVSAHEFGNLFRLADQLACGAKFLFGDGEFVEVDRAFGCGEVRADQPLRAESREARPMRLVGMNLERIRELPARPLNRAELRGDERRDREGSRSGFPQGVSERDVCRRIVAEILSDQPLGSQEEGLRNRHQVIVEDLAAFDRLGVIQLSHLEVTRLNGLVALGYAHALEDELSELQLRAGSLESSVLLHSRGGAVSGERDQGRKGSPLRTFGGRDFLQSREVILGKTIERLQVLDLRSNGGGDCLSLGFESRESVGESMGSEHRPDQSGAELVAVLSPPTHRTLTESKIVPL